MAYVVSTKGTALTLFVAFWEAFLFGGTSSGWNLFVYILKQDGVYSSACPRPEQGEPNNHTIIGRTDSYKTMRSDAWPTSTAASDSGDSIVGCSEQDAHFSLAYTLNIALVGVQAFPIGGFFDRIGLRITRTVSILILIASALMLGFVNPATSWLIYPGLLLLGLGNITIMITSSHVAGLAGEKAGTCIAIFTGGFSASGIVFLFVKLASDAGFPRQYSLLIFVGLLVMSFILTFVLFPSYKVPQTLPLDVQVVEHAPPVSTTEKIRNPENIYNENIEEKTSLLSTDKQGGKAACGIADQNVEGNGFLRHVMSAGFMLHIYWFAVGHVRVQYYVGSFNAWVTDVSDNNESLVSTLSNAFGYMTFCTLFLSPAVGVIMDKRRKATRGNKSYQQRALTAVIPLTLACIFGAMLNAFMMIETMWATYISIGLLQIHRALLYPACFIFLYIAFPADHYGKLIGVTYFIGGLANFLQYGFFSWAEAIGSFFPSNALFLCLVVLSSSHPLYIYVQSRRAIN